MTLNKKIITGLMAFATCMAIGSTSFADDWRGRDRDWHDNDRGRGHYNEKHWDKHHGDYRRPVVVINNNDRVVIRDYYRYRPYQVVYRPVYQQWRAGYMLPRYVQYDPIPVRLQRRLAPIPVGYEYVRIDNNILLIEDASRLIVDILRLS
ncbi:MAG TPA: RcnB family protein [Alphaproteobacteria bacterium]